MEGQRSQSFNPRATHNSGTPGIGVSQPQNLFWADSRSLDNRPIPHEDPEPMWQRLGSDVNDLGTIHQFDVDEPIPDQHIIDQTSFPLLTGDHPLGQTIDLPFTQRDNVLFNNPNDMFNQRLPYASPQELEYAQGVYPALPFQPDLGQIVEVPERTGLQLSQEIQMFMDNKIHVNGSGSDQHIMVPNTNSFPLPTSNHPSGQNTNFLFTQWDNVPLDNANLSLYQFDNSLPHVLPPESEYVSGVYPVLPVQGQLDQAIETSLQLGPEIQTFELQANGSGQDQYIIMGQNNFPLPTGDHPSEHSAGGSSTQGDNVPLDNPNLSSDQFDSPFSQVSSRESASEFTEHPQTPELQNIGDDGHPGRWPCPDDNCNATFGRPQEVTRHIRAAHQPQHNCPFPLCHTTWNRADFIRRHIANRHRGDLTEEKLQELGSIRTRECTIRFLEELRIYAAGIMSQSAKWDQRRRRHKTYRRK